MRKFSLVLFAALLFVAGSALANSNTEKPSKTLSYQIKEMLSNNSLDKEYNGMHAQVRFTFNKEGEIVVLSVDTEDASLEGFVKGRLNYKKVETSSYISEGTMYTVSVLITA